MIGSNHPCDNDRYLYILCRHHFLHPNCLRFVFKYVVINRIRRFVFMIFCAITPENILNISSRATNVGYVFLRKSYRYITISLFFVCVCVWRIVYRGVYVGIKIVNPKWFRWNVYNRFASSNDLDCVTEYVSYYIPNTPSDWWQNIITYVRKCVCVSVNMRIIFPILHERINIQLVKLKTMILAWFTLVIMLRNDLAIDTYR